MSNESGAYYTEERWQNWLDRLEAEEIDPDDEDSARLLLNLQDDTALAIVKIITDYEEDVIDEEAALQKVQNIEEIVLSEVEVDDDEKAMLIDGVQMSLICVVYAAQEFVASGPAEGPVEEYIDAAAEAEANEDIDAALGYCVQAGTRVIDGDELDLELAETLEADRVAQWVNGLDSLQTALSDPEMVEEEDE
jgi:hypothetical protein